MRRSRRAKRRRARAEDPSVAERPPNGRPKRAGTTSRARARRDVFPTHEARARNRARVRERPGQRRTRPAAGFGRFQGGRCSRGSGKDADEGAPGAASRARTARPGRASARKTRAPGFQARRSGVSASSVRASSRRGLFRTREGRPRLRSKCRSSPHRRGAGARGRTGNPKGSRASAPDRPRRGYPPRSPASEEGPVQARPAQEFGRW